MAKKRVGQLAKELKIPVADALAWLRKNGVEVKTNLSAVNDRDADRLRAAFSSVTRPAAPAKPAARARAAASATTSAAKKPAATKSSAKGVRKSAAKTPVARSTAPSKTAASRVGARPAAGGASAASAARTPGAAGKPAGAARKPMPSPAVPARRVPSAAGTRPVAPAGARSAVTARPGTPLRAPGPRPGGDPQAARPAVIPARPGAQRPGAVTRPAPGGAPARPGAPAARPGVPPRPERPGMPPGTGQGALQRPGAYPRPGVPGAVPRPPMARRMPPGARMRPPQRRPPHRKKGGPQPAPPPRPTAPPAPVIPAVLQKIAISEGVTVKELSEKMGLKAKDIITRLMTRGVLATINQPLDVDAATEVCREFGYEASVLSFEEEAVREQADESRPADLRPRDPVVTIMGHVDHGKTSLLDAIRSSNIAGGEKGGITQHIGAYHIEFKKRGITFIDTPGHEAFTMMRARGARVTDIVVLVVAADDGVMPQTVEAIDHARAAGVPIVVAINKVDKPSANLDRVKKQMSENGLLVEDWGGDVVAVPISAKAKTGIEDLLDMLMLVADMHELKADPDCLASGTVLESRLDRARGAVATIVVQRGTLRVGAPFIAGAVHGKVRAMFDDLGHKLTQAGPSIPVEVIGLEGVPKAGDPFQVLEAEWKVRQIGAFRQQKLRQETLAKSSRLTLDHLYIDIKEGTVKELPLVVKADVQGSVEAVSKTLTDLPSDKVKIKVIHSGVGAVTETDILLASASNAIIIAYNVRPERSAMEIAEKEKVDVRLHSVIYDITEEIRKAMVGMLEPESKEVYIGRADVRQVFKVPKIGAVAGCHVSDGRMLRTAEARLLRDNVVVYTGKVSSLRRFKDDASEVKAGYECGIGLANFNDIKIGDVIEAFRIEKIAAKSL